MAGTGKGQDGAGTASGLVLLSLAVQTCPWQPGLKHGHVLSCLDLADAPVLGWEGARLGRGDGSTPGEFRALVMAAARRSYKQLWESRSAIPKGAAPSWLAPSWLISPDPIGFFPNAQQNAPKLTHNPKPSSGGGSSNFPEAQEVLKTRELPW